MLKKGVVCAKMNKLIAVIKTPAEKDYWFAH